MIAWIAQTLVASSLLMLAVLVSRRIVARWFGARIAYALWALPVLRMLLPPLPGFRAFYEPALVIAPAAAPATVEIGLMPAGSVPDPFVLPPEVAHALDAAPAAASADWPMLLMSAWLAGALLFFGWQMWRYRRFVAHALTGATHLDTTCGVEMWMSDRVEGPIASGVRRRRIFLPRDFIDRYSSAERRQALLHEGAHHDRGDLFANFAAIAALSLHWWNPLAFVAYRGFRADQELACDATVLARADPEQAYAYGRALVKSTVGRAPVAACAFNRTDEIKRRLKMIKRTRLSLPRRIAGGLIAIATVGGGLLLTASGSSVPVEPPARPAMPVPPVPPHRAGSHVTVIREVVTGSPGEALPVAPVPPLPPEAPAAVGARRAAGEAVAAADRAEAQARIAEEQARIAERHAAAFEARADRPMPLMPSMPPIPPVPSQSAIRKIVATSLTQARTEMASSCATRVMPVAAGEQDWGTLALCGTAAFHAHLVKAMEEARAQLAHDTDVSDEEGQRALSGIDAAISRMKARTVG